MGTIAIVESSTDVNNNFVEAVGTLESQMHTMRKESLKPHVTSKDTDGLPDITRYSMDFHDPNGTIKLADLQMVPRPDTTPTGKNLNMRGDKVLDSRPSGTGLGNNRNINSVLTNPSVHSDIGSPNNEENDPNPSSSRNAETQGMTAVRASGENPLDDPSYVAVTKDESQSPRTSNHPTLKAKSQAGTTNNPGSVRQSKDRKPIRIG